MKKGTLFIVMLAAALSSFAQETVSYNLPEDDPYKARNLSFVVFTGIDYGRKAVPLAEAVFYTGRHFSAEADYETSLFQNNGITDVTNLNPYHQFDCTLAIHFIDKAEGEAQSVTTSQSTDGTYIYSNSFGFKANARSIKAVRLGISGFNSYLVAQVHDTPTGIKREYINYKSVICYIGLLSKRVFNYSIDYGDSRTMKRMREFYFDVMLPLSSSRDSTKSPIATDMNDIDKPVYHSWGARLGWMHHSARVVGTYIRVEAGWLPGWQQSGSSGSFYTMLDVGICLSSGALKYKTGE